MSRIADARYLRTDQYADAGNLNARIALHARFSTNPQGWLPWVFAQLELPPTARILEVGCGPGSLWVTNRERVPPGWTLTLSDFSAGMAQEAQRQLRGGGPAARFLVGDAQALPFPAAGCDAVLANHMLYHVPDRPRALAEIRRVLRPGGTFYAATNGLAHLGELRALLHRFQPDPAFWDRSAFPLVAPAGSPADQPFFSLEQGARELPHWFSEVTLRRYPDALLVTEAAPLVAYIRSMSASAYLAAAQLAALTRFVEHELATQGGAIRITKDTGLFIAH